jgi:hypothetical protein
MRKLFFMLLLAAITTLSCQALSVTNTSGRLAQAIDEELDITSLTVTGTMDARDFLFITNSLANLTTLDLSGVTITPYSKGSALYGTVTAYQGNEIPRTAFFGKKLTSVTLPDNLESIGFAAFAGCYQLRSITLPATLAYIDDYAFAGTALTSIEVPQSVQLMGKGVFSRCESMTSAVINGRTIGDFAFLGDIKLANVNVGASVSKIGRGAFNGCKLLQTLNIDPACHMTRIDEEAFINSGLQNINIKSLGVGTIGDWAFAQTKLSSLQFSDETTSLGEGALAHNPLLTTVTLPGLAHRPGSGRGNGNDDDNPRFNAPGPRHSLDRISDYTFAGDEVLQPGSMLQEGVAVIGNYALYNVCADIDTMRLPSSVVYLGDRAMAGMTGMQVLKTNAADVPLLGEEVWFGVDQPNIPLIAPSAESTDRYRVADQWMYFFFNTGDDYLLGDVNGDGSVTIADVTTLIDYLLGGGGDVDVRASDVNKDGSVTIADVTTLIDMLLGGNAGKSLQNLRLLGKRLPVTSDALALSTVSMRAGDTRTIEVALNNDEHDYTALQCEVVLPEGLTLVGVNGIDRGSEHNYFNRANTVEENVYTIMGVSFTNAKYAGSEGNVMSLTVTATEEYGARQAEVVLTNVVLVTTDNETYLAGDATGMINDNLTGVEQLTADKEVAGIRYINVAGQESDTPFDGMNIVVTTYTDGTISTVKVLK